MKQRSHSAVNVALIAITFNVVFAICIGYFGGPPLPSRFGFSIAGVTAVFLLIKKLIFSIRTVTLKSTTSLLKAVSDNNDAAIDRWLKNLSDQPEILRMNFIVHLERINPEMAERLRLRQEK